MFQDQDCTLAERSIEVLEYEMRIRLANGTFAGVGEIVAEEDVVKREGGCWTVR